MPSLRASYRDWRRLLSDIISALSVEYELAQRVVAGGKAYILVDGKEVASEDGKYVYRFKMEKLLGGEPAFTDVPVKVVDGRQNVIRGEILSIDGDVILLSLEKKPATRAVHQANINATNLKKLKIPQPTIEEQGKITEILSTVDKKLEIEKTQKAKLERIKGGLMDLLLTGKIRVKVGQ
jgi:restriction endonuclease S subunit